jgi:hypothetical protein
MGFALRHEEWRPVIDPWHFKKRASDTHPPYDSARAPNRER